MLPCVYSVIDYRGYQNACGKNNSDTLSYRLVCHGFVQKLDINPKTGA